MKRNILKFISEHKSISYLNYSLNAKKKEISKIRGFGVWQPGVWHPGAWPLHQLQGLSFHLVDYLDLPNLPKPRYPKNNYGIIQLIDLYLNFEIPSLKN